jgi:hypothetical protein
VSQADRTMEIDAQDILEEEVQGGGSISPMAIDPDSEPSLETSPGGSPSAKSKGWTEETVRIRVSPIRRRVLYSIPIGVVGLCAALLVTVALRPRGSVQSSAVAASMPIATASPRVSAPPPADTSWTSVAPLVAPPTSGTITVARNAGGLVVDGARVTSTSVVVACGTHSIRVGRGSARAVDVPCGSTVALDRNGKASVR